MKITSENAERGTRNSKVIVARYNSLLRQARAVRDGKDETLIFVEGLRLCEEALRSGVEIHAVVYSNEIAQKERAAALLAELGKVCERLGEVSESLLATVSYTKTPQGMIVLAGRPVSGKGRLAATKAQPHLLVIMDGINNPVNVGAIIRSAEAAGATGVITTGDSSDPFSPKALRGAMGSAFRLPIWNGASYREALAWCAEQQIKTVCTGIKATKLHTEIDWHGSCALILGSESTGLAEEQIEMAGAEVKIPMHGSVESLNVGVAAAVILYEAARQRMSH
jgi:RNA methyltransferase, TrmH family